MILPGFPVMIGGQGGFGQIPIGGIVLYDTISPPAGWELYYSSSMANRALRGVGPETTEKGTGGANQYTITGTTNSAGAHTGTGFLAFGNPTGQVFPGNPGARWGAVSPSVAHTHTISLTTSATPLTRITPLIRKTGAPGLLPTGASVLQGVPTLPTGFEEVTAYIGRVLRATNTGAGITGSAYPTSRTGISTATAGDHRHGGPANLGSVGPTFGPNVYDNVAAGSHRHTLSLTMTMQLKAVGLAQLRALSPQPVTPGMVIAYDGPAALPNGWREATGAAGTVDMRDHYPILAGLAEAGTVLGDGSVVWTLSSMSTDGAHHHVGANRGNVNGYLIAHGDSQGGHTHTVPTRGGTVEAAWYGIRFIQYLP